MINWVSEEDVPSREKKGTKQTDRKPDKFLIGMQSSYQEE